MKKELKDKVVKVLCENDAAPEDFDKLYDDIMSEYSMDFCDRYELAQLINDVSYHKFVAARRQTVEEGDIVKINDKIFVIAKIFNFIGYKQVDQDDLEDLAVLYSPIKKTLGFAWEGLYTDPSMCEIISRIDPKQIFREDIKI